MRLPARTVLAHAAAALIGLAGPLAAPARTAELPAAPSADRPAPVRADAVTAIDEAPLQETAASLPAEDVARLAEFAFDILPALRLPRAGSVEFAHLDHDEGARPVAPITAHPRGDDGLRRVHFALVASPTRLATLDDGSEVELHIDGLPGAPASPRDRVAPVLPQPVDPAAFSMGARWAFDDRLQLPLLDTIAWHAQADLATGVAPDPGATVIRRALRLSASWDRIGEPVLGLSQRVQVGGGNAFDHYATGITATLFGAPRSPLARFDSFVELSGEHLALVSLAQNTAATVRAGASWRALRGAEFELDLSHGLAPSSRLNSSIGLSMKF